MTIKKISVFCGAHLGKSPAYNDAANNNDEDNGVIEGQNTAKVKVAFSNDLSTISKVITGNDGPNIDLNGDGVFNPNVDFSTTITLGSPTEGVGDSVIGDEFVVDWPTSHQILDMFFVDTYREKHLNPIQNPGYTWTPNNSLNEVHDRIDFIYYSGQVELKDILIIGPDHLSDIVIDYFESDHRALFAKFRF